MDNKGRLGIMTRNIISNMRKKGTIYRSSLTYHGVTFC